MKVLVAPISFLWPGFNGVARYGLWSQLAIALLFSALCQATLALNFLWCDFLSHFFRVFLNVGLFVSWIVLSAMASSQLKRYEKMRKTDESGEAFLEAQTHYLKGEWFETECCLKNILHKNPYDADALLFLATLFRHVKRYVEADQTLAQLEKLDASYFWRYEIALEKEALKNDKKDDAENEKGGELDRNVKASLEKSEETCAKSVENDCRISEAA